MKIILDNELAKVAQLHNCTDSKQKVSSEISGIKERKKERKEERSREIKNEFKRFDATEAEASCIKSDLKRYWSYHRYTRVENPGDVFLKILSQRCYKKFRLSKTFCLLLHWIVVLISFWKKSGESCLTPPPEPPYSLPVSFWAIQRKSSKEKWKKSNFDFKGFWPVVI